MSTIDYFKYKALLAELETLKETKGPITKFINKVYSLSESLSTLPDNRESTRYAFMLITKAISYSAGVRSANKKITNTLDNTARNLTNSKEVTHLNVLETYEFWKDTLNFYPNTLEDLHRIEEILEIINGKKFYYISVYGIRALSGLDYNYAGLFKLYLIAAFGPDSLILKSLSNKTSIDTAQTISVLEEHLHKIKIILEEAHEQHSRGSTAV